MSIHKLRRAAVFFLVVFSLAACESGLGKTVFIVVPNQDGSVGSITVEKDGKKQVLNKAYAAAHVDNSGELKPVVVKKAEITRIFAAALSARPILPERFTLNFISGKDALVEGSEKIIEALFADIARRSDYTVEVVGHTDRESSDKFNDRLSLRRANMVRQQLIKRGAEQNKITAVGRGERDPIIATPDGKAEPKNRRVEVTVR